MIPVHMDFDADLRAEILKYLPYDKNDQAVVSALATQRTNDLLITFLNWIFRHVHPHARQVRLSAEILGNPLLPKYKSQMHALIQKIENGTDLSPHLSERILQGFLLPKTGNRKNLNSRRDLDMLLNDWGIHHLHLSQEMNGRFVKRSREDKNLLFAIFTQDEAYILDIAPHGAWTSQHLVEIAVRNWPDDELFWKINGILPSGTIMTPEERASMRGAGIGTHIEVNGKVYFSRTGGITTAGTSTKVTMEIIQFGRHFADIIERSKTDPEYLRPFLENTGKTWPADPEFHLMFVSSQIAFHLAVREEKTGAIFGIWQFFHEVAPHRAAA